MTDYLSQAFNSAERSYLAARSVANRAADAASLLARGSSSLPLPSTQSELARATQQLRANRHWVFAAVRAIAQRIAGQPLLVGTRKKPSGRKSVSELVPLESHALLNLFDDPNPLQTSWSLIYLTVASLELTGRSLWWIPAKKQIWPLPMSWLVDFEGDMEITGFRIRAPGQADTTLLPADECCYFSLPSPEDLHSSLGPLQACGSAVELDAAILKSQSNSFHKGLHGQHAIILGKNPHPDVPGGLRPKLTGAQERQLLAAVERRYSQVENSGSPIVLDGWIEDVRRISPSVSEMDWPNSAQQMKSRILQCFGCNPVILGELEGANRASAEAADKHFIDSTVSPLCRLMSLTMTAWLGPMFGNIEIWIQPPIASDTEASLKWAELLAKTGSISGDELRMLSPFDLEVGSFPEPVQPQAPAPQEASKTAEELFVEMTISDILKSAHHGNGHGRLLATRR